MAVQQGRKKLYTALYGLLKSLFEWSIFFNLSPSSPHPAPPPLGRPLGRCRYVPPGAQTQAKIGQNNFSLVLCLHVYVMFVFVGFHFFS